MAYLLCVSFGDSSGLQTGRMPGHTGGRNMVSLRCEFSCASSSVVTGRRTLNAWSKRKEFFQCGFFWCFLSLLVGEKDLSQTGQGVSCSLLLVRFCDFKLEELGTDFSQMILSSKGLSPE